MKKKNQITRTNRYILIGLSVFCAFMMVLSSFSDKAAGPFRILANVTVVPLQQGINHVGGWLGDLKDNFATLQQLQEENDRLKEQVDALTTENNYLLEESYEYERLQELYELDQNYAEYEKTAAHVIGRDSGNWFNTFTIDKGSLDGIEADMNVLAGSGLAGIVTEVGPTWSKVRSIIDDSTNVSGMVLSTSDTCIISGDLSLMSTGQIAFDQMENNDKVVAVGDQIYKCVETDHVAGLDIDQKA